ncbi:MAG: SMP-30/gluconolactonase/LRE family protein [Moorea sp. SIOASIH]|uniref:SMP-30/gluconolactonase/LRE family protein n=1 Tax=Moorena sp. SIOASIH TaxID=2607817 RepID=UPI0013BC8CA8|nr:SMP-30/gluconolactonase/LRE family protein [Moorena sp. SIOASIH]NEO40896.1 SMP-30/gluconolactonase/LRE family protein [Moorena sp. SIOASIH]
MKSIHQLVICLLLLFTVLFTLPTQALAESSLAAIMDTNAQVEQVATGFEFTEGPVWNDAGFLLFSDIPANTIYQFWTADEKLEVFRHPSGNANGNTFNREGHLLTAEYANRRISITEKDGTVVTLASQYQGKSLNSPNDLVVKSDGSIYFTDPCYSPRFLNYYNLQTHPQELGFYGVYRLAPEGKLTLLARNFVHPNGIAFSPDEQKLYISDFQKGHIRVFDVQPDGTLSNGHIFAELKTSGKPGGPDGMKIDLQGNVYSTGPGGVWIFSPSANLLGIIEVPEIPAANLAWGDSDKKTLYITAKTSIYRIHLKIPGVTTIALSAGSRE